MQFAVEAMRSDGSTVTEHIEAADRTAAVETLRGQGLLVLRLERADETPRAGWTASFARRRSRVTTRDLILFTRQMKMLLEAGAPLVPALEAAEQQTAKPAMHDVLHRLREHVEEGSTLSGALAAESHTFDPVFCSMVAAGEATASLPQIFTRLGTLAQQRQHTRKLLLGALIYPIVLSTLLVGVVGVLLFFVVPRFKTLFASLHSPLPATTQLLFQASDLLKHGWPYGLGGLVAVVAAAVVCLRLPGTRRQFDELMLRLPVIGALVSRLTFGKVVRVWAAMLRCHVPLLETIRQSRAAVTNASFLQLLTDVEGAVAAGGRMGQALAAAGLADPVVVSAIRIGEDNGRLAEATDFVSDWIDEDNGQAVQHITRLAEPVLLAVMGLVVGLVAMSLFVPLFDLATAGG